MLSEVLGLSLFYEVVNYGLDLCFHLSFCPLILKEWFWGWFMRETDVIVRKCMFCLDPLSFRTF